jgi:Zn-finger domain-containing protein
VINQNAKLKDFREELTFKEFDYYYDNLNKLPIVEWDDVQDWLKT